MKRTHRLSVIGERGSTLLGGSPWSSAACGSQLAASRPVSTSPYRYSTLVSASRNAARAEERVRRRGHRVRAGLGHSAAHLSEGVQQAGAGGWRCPLDDDGE